jgi:hypothetical protein
MVARRQQAAMPVIGYLSFGSPGEAASHDPGSTQRVRHRCGLRDPRRARPLIVGPHVLFQNAKKITELTASHKVSAIYPGRGFAAAGGLMSYTADGNQRAAAPGVGARVQVCCENGGRPRAVSRMHQPVMDDEPREQISELEVQIGELADALERCRKTALASKAAMGLGAVLTAATTLGVVTLDPMVMVADLATLLGGVVVFGSNTSTVNQLSESMRSAEAQRAALIGQLDIRLVEDAPQIGIPENEQPPRSGAMIFTGPKLP